MDKRTFFILLGTAAALLLSLLRRKKYDYSAIKVLILTPIFIAIAAGGAILMGLIESGFIGNVSLYGCLFITAVAIPILCLITKDDMGKMHDFYVAPICLMMSVLRANCLVAGCCYGIELFEQADGSIVRFPSQIVELITSLLLMVMFLCFEKKQLFKGKHYPLFFIAYGITRFILNFFRGDKPAFVWFIPSGHFWSIVAIAIGLMWLILTQEDNESEITVTN